jgi:hypothetical protein
MIPVDRFIKMGEMGIYPGYDPEIKAILDDESTECEEEEE